MVKILVLYDSVGGNTEKMARSVADGVAKVEGVDLEIKKVDSADLEDLIRADGIILGSPTYYGQMSGKLKSFIDKSVEIHGKLEGKAGGAFTSAGGSGGGAETTLLSIIQSMLIHGMVVYGRCDGEHYGAVSIGTPGEHETESCEELGMRISLLACRLKKGRMG